MLSLSIHVALCPIYEGTWTFFGIGLADVHQMGNILPYTVLGSTHICIHDLGMTAVSGKKKKKNKAENLLMD